jgi:hypothetical protein
VHVLAAAPKPKRVVVEVPPWELEGGEHDGASRGQQQQQQQQQQKQQHAQQQQQQQQQHGLQLQDEQQVTCA